MNNEVILLCLTKFTKR